MLLLDELFDGEDFSSAARGLALEFRKEHGLPEIHQLGLAVAEVEAAADSLEARGIGPFFVASGAPPLWRERGREREFAGKLGIAYHEGLMLELLEPGAGSDFYRQSLDPGGKVVVQHLGMLVEDVDEWARRLESAGHECWVRGRIKSGPMSTEFAYMDTVAAAGLVLEFINWRLLGRTISPPPAVFHAVGRFQKLIGKRSFSM